MRAVPLIAMCGILCTAVFAVSARAKGENSRTVTLPYDECLSIIAETSQELGEEPLIMVNTSDEKVVRIKADDGFVTVSCSRLDNKMTLAKSVVPAAAGLSATR